MILSKSKSDSTVKIKMECKCLLIAYFIHNNLYLLIPYSRIALRLFPFSTGLFSVIRESISFLLYSLVCCILLDSTYKRNHTQHFYFSI